MMLRGGLEDALRQHPEPFREQAVEPALAGLRIRDLSGLMRDRSVPFSRQDEVLAAVIRCYRRSHHPVWAAALLDMVAPALSWACGRIHCLPDGVDADDIGQQAVLQTLAAADRMWLPDPPRWAQRRLLNRVRDAINRWLRRVRRSSGCTAGAGEQRRAEVAEASTDPWNDVDLMIEVRRIKSRVDQELERAARAQRARAARARRAGLPVGARRRPTSNVQAGRPTGSSRRPTATIRS
jgi:hypothetical protein